MRNILLIILLLASKILFAQDVIYLKNGDELVVKVKELKDKEVLYTKINQPKNDSIFTVLNETIFKIKFENGENKIFYRNNQTVVNNNNVTTIPVDTTRKKLPLIVCRGASFKVFDERIKMNEAREYLLLSGNVEAIEMFRIAKAKYNGSKGLIVTGIVVGSIGTVVGAATALIQSIAQTPSSFDQFMYTAFTVGGVGWATLVGGITMNINSKADFQKSIDRYNNAR